MGWSTIQYGELIAHAHDSEQDFFMYLAPAFLDSADTYHDVDWLQQWRAFWVGHRDCYANGLNDIELATDLTTPDRVELFRGFLAGYCDWIRAYGDAIPVDTIRSFFEPHAAKLITEACQTQWLIDFTEKIVALLDADSTHASVFALTVTSAEQVGGDQPATRGGVDA